MTSSLVGSEMCIRDSLGLVLLVGVGLWLEVIVNGETKVLLLAVVAEPVSYTHLTLPTICSV
eukprot:9142240-Prorocentrum_lima.AAC.1